MYNINFAVDVDSVDNDKIIKLLDAIREVARGRRAADYEGHVAARGDFEEKLWEKATEIKETIAEAAIKLGTEAGGKVLSEAARAEAEEKGSAAVVPPPPPPTVEEINTVINTATGEIELDDKGYPWDARIHRTSKKQAAKGGAWLVLRSIDKELVKSVQAEHRAAGYGIPPKPGTTTPDAPAAPNAADIFGAGNTAPPPPPTTETNVTPITPVTFQSLLERVTSGVQAGEFDTRQVENAIRKEGGNNLATMVAADQKTLDAVYNALSSLAEVKAGAPDVDYQFK